MSTDAGTPETATDSTQDRWVRRIQGMIALAERAGTPEEADAAMARAYAAMERHAIDETMLGKTQQHVAEQIETGRMEFTGIYAQAMRTLALAVARAVNCRGVYTQLTKVEVVTVHGFTSDLERWKMITVSLQLQATSAVNAWTKSQSALWKERSAFNKFKDKRQFVESFGYAAADKISAATRVATQEYAADRVTATEGRETVEDATTGVEIAIRDRKEQVQDWFDKYYGNSLRSGRARRSSGSYSASAAGRDAGSRADVGTTRVGGGRRALGQ